jgi:hypothetical protein
MEFSLEKPLISCAATQELPSTLWSLKVYYDIHKSLPILGQTNSVHTTPYIFVFLGL